MFHKWLKVLSECTLFRGTKPDELNATLSCLGPRVHEYKKNECIAVAGDKYNGLGVVLSGSIAVAKESAAGSRIIMMMLESGDMFGEMAAFSSSGVWPATITANENSTVMFLPPNKIVGECEHQCASHKLLITNMLRILSEKALMLNRKVEYLAIKSMRGKISTFLLEQHKKIGKTTFMMPLNRNELADFLNVSRPSLSREMGRMRDEGIIEFHMESVKINDIEALRAMAE